MLILSGHIGSWEIMAARLAAVGYPLTLLVGPQRNRRVQEMFTRFRARHGVQVLVRGTDLRQIFKALKAGRVVATLGDQDAGRNGWFVDFLGGPHPPRSGPIASRVARGRLPVMGFCVRSGATGSASPSRRSGPIRPGRGDPGARLVSALSRPAGRLHPRVSGAVVLGAPALESCPLPPVIRIEIRKRPIPGLHFLKPGPIRLRQRPARADDGQERIQALERGGVAAQAFLRVVARSECADEERPVGRLQQQELARHLRQQRAG